MGLFWAMMLALAVFVAVWGFAKLEKGALLLLAVALCVGLAGYAAQGRPTLAGAPAAAAAETQPDDSGYIAMRHAILGQFDSADHWLIIADSYLRTGQTQDAVDIIRGGLRAHPEDMDLWIGLGHALVRHADGLMTPAARMAFDRARAVAPGNPAPDYFYGLSLAEGGDFDGAERMWRKVLADTPPTLSWRPIVEERLRRLAIIRSMLSGAGGMTSPPDSAQPDQ